MSRYHYSSYPTQRAAPRWPWALGIVLVAAFVAAGVVLVRDDLAELRQRGGAADSAEAPAEVAAAATTAPAETGAGTTDGSAMAVDPDPSGESPAAAPLPNVTVPTVAATEPAPPTAAAPTATLEPTPAPTAVPAQAVVQTYVERWNAGDYNGLYELLSRPAQQAFPRDQFVERYRAIAERAGLTKVAATVDGDPNLQSEVPIRVDLESSLVGAFTELNRVRMVREGTDWKIDWTPSLIFKDLGADGCIDVGSETPPRGRILDRNKKVLAEDGPIMQVAVVPGEIEDERRVLRELSDLTDLSAEEIKAKYEGRDAGQYWIIKEFPQARERELIDTFSDVAGVRVNPSTGRVYPLGPVAAHVTGYVSEVTAEQLERDPSLSPGQIVGQAGIEAGADDELTGQPGGKLVVVQCETRAERKTIAARPAVPAKDLVLTIDRELQEAAAEALTAQGNVKGSAVVLDPRTGAVLAMVSHPTFDPNGFVLGFTDREWRTIADDKLKPLLNRAAEAGYPTGSIFKSITTAAAMEHLGYTADSVIDCPSTFSLEGATQVWEDWTVAAGLGPQGPMTLHNALVNSCNTVFYQLGAELDRTDDKLLPDMAKAFGLGAPTDIPLLPEVGGTVPDPKWKLDTFGDYWATGDAVNLAIGQGFLEATPLQMATAYAAIANGGDLLQPYIVAEAVVPGGATEAIGKRTVRSVLPVSASNLRAIQAALRDQTSNPNAAGSARVFGDFAWPIAGKTGTAQNQSNRAEKPHSWFAAFGPSGEEATIASIVMVEGVGEGVSFAAPATRQIYEAYLRNDLSEE